MSSMNYKAWINILPKKELLDPQGKTVRNNLHNIDLDGIEDVRIGKRIEMLFSAKTATEAAEKVESACAKLLANVIMEDYEYTIEAV